MLIKAPQRENIGECSPKIAGQKSERSNRCIVRAYKYIGVQYESSGLNLIDSKDEFPSFPAYFRKVSPFRSVKLYASRYGKRPSLGSSSDSTRKA